MTRRLIATGAAAFAMSALMFAQGGRPASPAGTAATEVGGKYDPNAAEPSYQGGKWIEITYGRPIKRGRDVLGGERREVRQGRQPRRAGLARGRQQHARSSRPKCRW